MPLALALLVLTAAWRMIATHVPVFSNFSPVMALVFCAGVYCRDRKLWLAPLVALVLSDLYIDHYYATVYHYDWSRSAALLRILCFLVGLGLGLLVSRRRTWLNLLSGALAGALIFYFVTNTASWLTDPGYTHNAAGWWQAMTVGLPQFLPTLFFFRNTLCSDLLFTAAFALAMEYASLRRGAPSLLAPRPSSGV